LKIGYMPDTHNGSYDRPEPANAEVSEFVDQLFAETELAERYGFDSVQIPERHGRTETVIPSPLVLMSALAARTSRIRLGTYILILPLHNPMDIAEQFAVIDQMSRGRVIVGLASGYHSGYSDFYGVPHNKRGEMFEEGFELMMRAWTEGKFSFEGKYYQVRDALLTPKPYQKPRPELWIGGMFPKTIARAGKLGDAWCSDPFPLQPDVWREQVQIYKESARQHGHKAQIVLMREAWCAPSRKEADEKFLPIALKEWLFYFRWGILTHHPDFKTEADFTPDRARPHFIMGTPDDCIQQLERYERDYGVDYMVLRFRLPYGPPKPEVLKSLELFGKEVMPHFQQRSTSQKAS